MPKFRGLLVAPLLCSLLASPAAAGEADDASAKILVATLHANKKALVAVNLGLTDAEASAFWPIYDRYQLELDAVQARLLAVIEAYRASFGSLSDPDAIQLVKDYLAIEGDRAAVRRSFLAPISEVLPGRKVMRFFQIENKVEAVLRYELASTIPVVQE